MSMIASISTISLGIPSLGEKVFKEKNSCQKVKSSSITANKLGSKRNIASSVGIPAKKKKLKYVVLI